MLESQFHALAHTFLDALFQDLHTLGVELKPQWDIDHLCYRTDSTEHYQEMKENFSKIGRLLVESPVNGRMIATFKLFSPIVFSSWEIHLVELPAPKPGKIVPRGLEHIEVVIDETFLALRERYPHLSFDQKGLQKDYNQELEMILGERNIKFHHSSLESVVTLEKNERVWGAIQNSGVLRDFFSYYPLVVGTFPLGLETSDSDVAILLQSFDFLELKNKLLAHFGTQADFSLKEVTVEHLETLICCFRWDTVPFELFVQNIPPVKQKAWRHFFIEEKLLKYRGDQLRERVFSLRHRGMKTEPAFALSLNLPGDPYEALLSLSDEHSGRVLARS
jgi:predicted metalloenzyme YecM